MQTVCTRCFLSFPSKGPGYEASVIPEYELGSDVQNLHATCNCTH